MSTDEAAANAPNRDTFIRDDKLWLDDGNIIVRAGSGAGGAKAPIHAFKCHRSVLKLNSTVFATLFEIPTSGNTMIDEVECVDLPERWEDVRDLLWSFYGLFEPLEEVSGPQITPRVAGCFKLSKKYDVATTAKKLQTILDSVWPDSLDDWIALEKSRFEELNEAHVAISWVTDLSVNVFWPEPGLAVRLARETRTRSFFRAALYGLCRANVTLPISEYQHMFEGPDFAASVLGASPDHLGTEELWLLTVGRERIQNRVNHLAVFHLPEVIRRRSNPDNSPGCRSEEKSCSEPLQRWFSDEMARNRRELSCDPIWELTLLQEKLERSNLFGADMAICATCRNWFSQHLALQTRLFWDWLPEAFDLDKLGLD